MLCYKMMLFEKKNPLPRKKHFKVKKKKNKTHTPHIHTVGSNKQYKHVQISPLAPMAPHIINRKKYCGASAPFKYPVHS